MVSAIRASCADRCSRPAPLPADRLLDAQQLLGNVLDLFIAVEHMGIEHFLLVRSVEPLDGDILVGLARFDVVESDASARSLCP